MSAPLADAEARSIAAGDFQRNLVVQAGAGSGKTSLLVERALHALARGVVEAEDIAAITFTDKAAAEMLLRLAEGLNDLQALARDHQQGIDPRRTAVRAFAQLVDHDGIPREMVWQRATRSLERMHRMQICTLHTFCADILRAWPGAAGVDPAFAVDQGLQKQLFFEKHWDEFLARELGPQGQRDELWHRVLSRCPVPRLTAAASTLSGFEVPEALILQAGDEAHAHQLLQPELVKLQDAVDTILSKPEWLTKTSEPFFSSMQQALRALAGGGFADARDALARSTAFAERIHEGKGGNPRKQADEPFKRLCKQTQNAGSRLLRNVARTDASLIRDVLELLLPFIRSFRHHYLRAGHVDFAGLLHLTRELLVNHPDIRRQVRQRHKLLFVDEFQDTDPVQYDIVLLLTEVNDGAASEPYAATLEPGRLFIVGDPKQSIYRFRGADYASFHQAVDRICRQGGLRLDLKVNFRSRQSVLDPINSLFAHEGIWRASDYQPEYLPIQPPASEASAVAQPPVEVWTVPRPEGQGKDNADARRQREGRAVAEGIQRLNREEGIPFRCMTVLFRAFTSIDTYLRALRRAGIPFVVDRNGRDFTQRPEVEDLTAILRALDRPGDPLAILAFLRSTTGAVPDTELSSYHARQPSWAWQAGDLPSADSYPCLRAAFETLRRLADETAAMPADDIVDHVLRHTGLLPLSAAAHEGAQRVASLRHLANQAITLSRDGSLTLAEVVEALEESTRSDLDADSSLADENEDAVQVMTVHKAKGLENDVILIPDLARRERNQPTAQMRAATPVSPSASHVLALDLGEHCAPEWAWHALEDARHQEAEVMRTLYVAMTRARNRLVLVSCEGGPVGSWLEALAAWGYDARNPPEGGALLDQGRVQHRIAAITPSASREQEEFPLPDLDQASRRWHEQVTLLRERSRRWLRHPSGLGEEQEAQVQDETRPATASPHDDQQGRAVGTLVHLVLEKGDLSSQPGLRAALRQHAPVVAADHGAEPAGLLQQAEAALEPFLDSPLYEQLRQGKVVGRELPVLVRGQDGVTWQGTLDLLLQGTDGQLHVVDYKTDRESDPGCLLPAYGDQLAVYASAVQRALALAAPPRAWLWMVRHGRSIEVPLEERLARLKLGPAGG